MSLGRELPEHLGKMFNPFSKSRATFGLREDQIAWDLIGKWTSKNYERSYSVVISYQPQLRVDSMLGSTFLPNGKPYKVTMFYFLKGVDLIICGLPIGSETEEFQFKELINLENISPITSPLVLKETKGIIFTSERTRVAGEVFYEKPVHDQDFPACSSFVVRFPEDGNPTSFEDAMRFSREVKIRANELIWG